MLRIGDLVCIKPKCDCYFGINSNFVEKWLRTIFIITGEGGNKNSHFFRIRIFKKKDKCKLDISPEIFSWHETTLINYYKYNRGKRGTQDEET